MVHLISFFWCFQEQVMVFISGWICFFFLNGQISVFLNKLQKVVFKVLGNKLIKCFLTA